MTQAAPAAPARTLAAFTEQLTANRQRFEALLDTVTTDAQFNWRPREGAWSIGECMQHLIMTADGMFPLFDQAIDRSRSSGKPPREFKYGWFSNWFVKAAGPTSKSKFKAPKAFVPASDHSALSRDDELATYRRVHERAAETLRSAEGIDTRIKVPSAAVKMIKMPMLAWLELLVMHEARHLAQMERVRADAAFPAE